MLGEEHLPIDSDSIVYLFIVVLGLIALPNDIVASLLVDFGLPWASNLLTGVSSNPWSQFDIQLPAPFWVAKLSCSRLMEINGAWIYALFISFRLISPFLMLVVVIWKSLETLTFSCFEVRAMSIDGMIVDEKSSWVNPEVPVQLGVAHVAIAGNIGCQFLVFLGLTFSLLIFPLFIAN